MTSPDMIAAPGWNEYKLLVLDQLTDLKTQVKNLEAKMDAFRADDIANVKVEIAMLKVKAGMWGALSGLITGLIAALVAYMKATGKG